MPFAFTLAPCFLVSVPQHQLGWAWTSVILGCAMLFNWVRWSHAAERVWVLLELRAEPEAMQVNYEADRDKLQVRLRDGDWPVWGRPPKLIRARYRTPDGGTKQSILLCSGWWGVARHMHYLADVSCSATSTAGTHEGLTGAPADLRRVLLDASCWSAAPGSVLLLAVPHGAAG